jgi:oligopeptide/dipeptide ABC transporter ATP-binding protein
MNEPLLEIKDLCVEFHTPEGTLSAVDGVELRVGAGESVGIVGESGCGKSVTALSVLRLVPEPPGKIARGRILFQGGDLLDLDQEEMRKVRGREISMVFQEPMTCLNPVMTIGHQVAEPLMVHRNMSKKEAMEHAAQWLQRVRIPSPKERLRDFPHQLSGGMRQRVMIAMALICHPKLLIADEPTTALDVTIQAQILALMRRLKEELNMALLLISHDLGIIAQMTSRVAVMYGGEVVEEAGVEALFSSPLHPYTEGLLSSMPPRDGLAGGKKRERLREIPGTVPSFLEKIEGCRFKDRCPRSFTLCGQEHPPIVEISPGHRVRCWLAMDSRRKG